MISIINEIIIELLRISIKTIEYLILTNVFILCRLLNRITFDIRQNIFYYFPNVIKKIKNDHNFLFVQLHCILLISSEYLLNRFWISLTNYLTYYVCLSKKLQNITFQEFENGIFGLIGINNMEIFDTKDNNKIIVENTNINNMFIKYDIIDDNIKLKGIVNDINSIEYINDKTILRNYTKTLLKKNIDRLSFINSKIYILANQIFDFDHPIMILIRNLCCETFHDRSISNTIIDISDEEYCEELDLSTLHKFTRNFYLDDELMLNFHFYKYCQQIQKLIGIFIVSFCEKHSKYIFNNQDVNNFVSLVSKTFNYFDDNDIKYSHDEHFIIQSKNIIHEKNQIIGLSIDDILLSVIFNIVEYSMNRIFIEYYWNHQNIFPFIGKNSDTINMNISRVFYKNFLSDDLNDLIGNENREKLLNSMYLLYSRFKSDNAPYVECINPYRMKKCVLNL